MKLCDKLIILRRKNGWSQEELADKLNVSRQAVSKWEGDQATPDVEKILQLAAIFNVSTDFLLKDELGMADIEEESAPCETANEKAQTATTVDIDTAKKYVTQRKAAAARIGFATYLCILSPMLIVLFSAISEYELFSIKLPVALGISFAVLFVLVTVAVALYIYSGIKNSPYEYIEKELIVLDKAAREYVEREKAAFEGKNIFLNILGAALCILSPLPMLLAAVTENEPLAAILTSVIFIIAGAGALFFIIAGVRQASLQKLLCEGEYNTKKRKKEPFEEKVGAVYCPIIVAIYLLWSFISKDWHITWLTFVISGALFPCVVAICRRIMNKSKDK